MINSNKMVKRKAETWTVEHLINKERINRLESVLAKYPDILLQYMERKNPEVYPDVLILETFRFEKHITSIEVFGIDAKRVKEFIGDLSEFFFVNYKPYDIHISRFRTLGRMAIGEFEEDGRKVELSDRNADYAGLFYGKSARQIVEYCLKEELYHFIKQ